MLVPRIDLKDGAMVCEGESVLQGDDTVALVERLGRYGEVALFDCDAHEGTGDNEDLIKRLVKKATCRVYGGIDDEDKARRLLRAGARRLVIDVETGQDIISRLPRHRVFVGIGCTPALYGPGGRGAVEKMQVLAPYCSGFVCSFGGDGLPGTDELDRVRAATGLPTAVEGIEPSDTNVTRLDAKGIDVQAQCLVPDRFEEDVRAAFVACVDFSEGLVPTIVQDRRGQVLALAWSDGKSLEESLETGWAAFHHTPWSDRENVFQQQEIMLLQAWPDCTRRALLFTVHGRKACCRRGTYSCFGFGDRAFGLGGLFDVIEDRRRNPRPGSYTSFLFETEDRIPRKLNEEVYELLTARAREDVIWEAADVMYFLLTFIARKGVSLDDVLDELSGRER